MMKSLSQILLLIVSVGPTSQGLHAASYFTLTEKSVIHRMVQESRLGKIARIEAALVQNEAYRAKNPYDSIFILEANHRINASDRITTVFGTRNDTTSLNLRYQKSFPIGTNIEAGFLSTRQTSNSPFATLDPAHEAAWTLSLRQPLWRNSFGTSLRSIIGAANITAEQAKAVSERRMDEFSLEAAQLFWQWIAFQSAQDVAKRAVGRAKEFLRITRKKAGLGIAENPDLYAAQANLAAREAELLAAKERSETTLTRLKNVLLLPQDASCQPGEQLKTGAPPKPVSDYFDRAQTARKDLKAAQKKVEAQELIMRAARSSVYPQFDLLTSLTLNAVNGGWGSASGDSFSTDHPNWFIGGEFVIPLENRTLRADVRRAELELKRAKLEFKQFEQDVRTQIQVAWTKLTSLQFRVAKAQQVKSLEQKKLKAKERDFRSGRSDALTIILYQEDLLRADQRLLALLAEEAIGRLNLQHATGTLSEKGHDPS